MDGLLSVIETSRVAWRVLTLVQACLECNLQGVQQTKAFSHVFIVCAVPLFELLEPVNGTEHVQEARRYTCNDPVSVVAA